MHGMLLRFLHAVGYTQVYVRRNIGAIWARSLLISGRASGGEKSARGFEIGSSTAATSKAAVTC